MNMKYRRGVFLRASGSQ